MKDLIEYQTLVIRAGGFTRTLGFVVFDRAEQKIAYSFIEPVPTLHNVHPLINYLKKEFSQMQEKMSGSLSFTPFTSLTEISSQLFPGDGGPVYFTPAETTSGGNLIQVLDVLKSSLSS